ncbi:MAG: Gfo/Idh/MocA family oxidoreductase [Planctomycetota bacterium]|nr:Gfo/Idh/MocA family oxidoreductase [Planctomycetota bacterium]MDA1106521.1 Gfo/Idh/MocA family oxidoreductase [Planctomycetota bacterium]
MSTRVGIGIIGHGFLAKTRSRCWARVFGIDVAKSMVAGRDPSRARAFAADHGWSRGGSIEELLSDPSITVVDLCVPQSAHRELCARAAAAGKHVLCTKPLTACTGQGCAPGAPREEIAKTAPRIMLSRACEDAQAMIDGCKRAGVQLFYGENWIFAPAFQRAAALNAASNGVILEMRGWESHSGSHSAYAKEWRHVGGGALLRLGSHPIGAMLWLKAREAARRGAGAVSVTRVTGAVADVTRAMSPGATCDVATGWHDVESWGTATMQFSDGSVGTVFGSDVMMGGMQSHMTILASDHRLEVALSPNDALRTYSARDGTFGNEYMMEKASGQAGWNHAMPDEDMSSGQQGLVQHVAECAANGTVTHCDGALGAEVVRVVYEAYAAAR